MTTTFKYKPNKVKYLTNIKTVDELHKERIDYFDKQNNDLPEKKLKLINLKKQLNIYENMPANKITPHIIKRRSLLNDAIVLLEHEIEYIENNVGEMEYYLTSGPVLIDYYDIGFDTIAKSPTNKEQMSNQIPIQSIETPTVIVPQTDLNKLNEYSKKKRKEKKPVKKRAQVNAPSVKSILEFLTENNTSAEKTVSNKATLFHEYLLLNDKEYISSKNKKNVIKYCTCCKQINGSIEKTLIQSEGIYVCQKCGEVEYIIIESEFPGHKDVLTEKPRYPYKKINHLIEKLNQFQSKETTNIPEEIYEKIQFEIKKRKYDIEQITPRFIKDILKKYRLTQYYEHTQYIYSKITKNPPPTLTREEEDQIKKMFKQIEEPFNKFRPAERSNFLNYSFVIHKLFILLKKDEHAKYFNLLKSKEKLKSQDKIWAKICAYLGWQFHPSI
jgi:hypothetical protein